MKPQMKQLTLSTASEPRTPRCRACDRNTSAAGTTPTVTSLRCARAVARQALASPVRFAAPHFNTQVWHVAKGGHRGGACDAGGVEKLQHRAIHGCMRRHGPTTRQVAVMQRKRTQTATARKRCAAAPEGGCAKWSAASLPPSRFPAGGARDRCLRAEAAQRLHMMQKRTGAAPQHAPAAAPLLRQLALCRLPRRLRALQQRSSGAVAQRALSKLRTQRSLGRCCRCRGAPLPREPHRA